MVAAAAALATLAFAGSALAANTASIAVWHSPMTLGASSSTTIHVSIPKSTDPIARLAIYVPSGYGATINQAPGANIGSVTATAFSYDTQLTLPLSGTVNTDPPANHTADACSPGTHAAIWILNLSVSGQTLQVPMYVDPTTGAEAALGAYKLVICLPPPDVPAGTPGRAAFGAQLLDAQFTVNNIFSTPSGGGLLRWESLFTPYNAGKGTVNAVGTFEARAFVPLPVGLSLGVDVHAEGQALRGRTARRRRDGEHPQGRVRDEARDREVRDDGRRRKLEREGQVEREGDEARLLQGDGEREGERLHGAGLPEPARADDRTGRLRQRDAAAVDGDEHRREDQAVTKRWGQVSHSCEA